MVKPRETPSKDPPPVESEEEESETESEDAANGKTPSVSKGPESESDSSSEDEEESGSESESDEDSPPKPIAMTEAEKTTTPAAAKKALSVSKPSVSTTPASTKKAALLKPIASGTASPTRKAATGAGAKRAAPEPATPAGDADSKRAKVKTGDSSVKKVAATPSGDEEKKLFARVFSEDDEVVILQGMSDFIGKGKGDPFIKIAEFHDFINTKIGGDKTKIQLLDKMRRMKKRYDNHVGKALKSGKERILSNLHEQSVYDLSKKIWGNEESAGEGETSVSLSKGNKKTVEVNGGEVKKTGTKVLVEVEGVKTEGELQKVKSLSFAPDAGSFSADWFLHEGSKLLEEGERIEMENKWKEFRLEEAALMIKKHALMLEHMDKVQNRIKSYDN